MTREAQARWVVVLCAVAAYGAALAGTFVYDDVHSVAKNTALLELRNIPRFFVDPALFSSVDAPMYRPVLLTSFALNAAPFGMWALAFKLVNLALHAATALVLFATLRRWPLDRGPALAAAALFAVHPLGSEAVNMISSRSELLVVLLLGIGVRLQLAALAGSRLAVAGTALCAALACGCKETGVVLPALLLAVELVRDPGVLRAPQRAVLRVLPAVLVVAGYLLVRRAVLGVATVELGGGARGSDLLSGGGRDVVTHWATMASLLPRVLGQALVPLGLSIDPPVVFVHGFRAPAALAGLVLGAVLTALGLRAPRRRPLLFLGTCFAWCTALPWVLVPLNTPLCEHRLYGPLFGLGLVAAALLPSRFGRWPAVVAAAVLLAFAGLAGARSLDYRQERRLWQKELDRGNESYHVYFGLALAAIERVADPDLRDASLREARHLLERALALYPRHTGVRRMLIETHLLLGPPDGDPFAALALADEMVQRAPTNPFHRLLQCRALTACGEVTGEAGWFDRAVASALACLEIAPPKGLVYRTAASARTAQRDYAGAIALLDTAVARGFDHAEVLVQRARLHWLAGHRAAAEHDLRAALSRSPFDPDANALADELRAASPPK